MLKDHRNKSISIQYQRLNLKHITANLKDGQVKLSILVVLTIVNLLLSYNKYKM